ncbi:methyltransferase domain-containing protein [Acephala macrosclerotiorum]|nr:methyltransferase domain-containing protein [Acephala macrosclerotiorum]
MYIGANNEYLAEMLSERTVNNSVSYILPILHSLPEGFTFLDVGCGPGSITIDIARRYPSATILGLDLPEAIGKARANAQEAGVTNIFFTVGDALDIQAAKTQPGFEALNGGCDVVHSHQLHMHVQDARKLMRELRAAAKPQQGVVCCRESDHGMVAVWPELPAMKQFISAIPNMLLGRGQDPYVARKFVSYALAAGFKREDIEASVGTWVYSTPAERRHWANVIVGSIQSQATSDKIQSEAEGVGSQAIHMSKVLEEWKAWVEAEDGWYAVPCPQVICRRND